MSHEIQTAVFLASEGAGWTGLGRAIPAHMAKDPRAIAELCDALWTVRSEPAYRMLPDGTYQTVADTALQVRSDTGRVLSITSKDRYHTTNRQPVDVFEAFRDELNSNGYEISHAAVLRGGAVIAVSAVMPEDYDIVVGRGDRMRSYLTLSTGYDKKHGTKATKGTIRVVCANTLAMSISEATKTDQLRTIRASTELGYDSLPQLLANVAELVAVERKTFDGFANARMSDADVQRFFANVLEIDLSKVGRDDANGKPLVSTRLQNQLAALTTAYATAPGADIAHGTAWGALNAVTYYATHEKTVRDTTEDGATVARIASNMTGDSARLKARGLRLLSATTPELATLLTDGKDDFSRLMLRSVAA